MHERASFPSKMQSKHASQKGIACCPQTSITSQSLARNDPKQAPPNVNSKSQNAPFLPLCSSGWLWDLSMVEPRGGGFHGPPGIPTLLVFFHQDSNTLVLEFLCGRCWLGSGPHQERCKQRSQSHPGVIQAKRAGQCFFSMGQGFYNSLEQGSGV